MDTVSSYVANLLTIVILLYYFNEIADSLWFLKGSNCFYLQ